MCDNCEVEMEIFDRPQIVQKPQQNLTNNTFSQNSMEMDEFDAGDFDKFL